METEKRRDAKVYEDRPLCPFALLSIFKDTYYHISMCRYLYMHTSELFCKHPVAFCMFRLRRRKRHSSFLVQRDVGHWQRCFVATRNVSPLQNRTGNAVAKRNGPRWCMSSIETWTHCLVNKINENMAIIHNHSRYVMIYFIFHDISRSRGQGLKHFETVKC